MAREASSKMRRSVAEVKGAHDRNEFLRYAQLKRLFKGLENKERAQLIDIIITTFNVIDYSCLKKYFP